MLKDFMRMAREKNSLVAVLLEDKSWSERVTILWNMIYQIAKSSSNLLRQDDNEREASDSVMASLIELYFEAIAQNLLCPFEKKADEQKMPNEADYKKRLEAEDAVPIFQADNALEIWRLLPRVGADIRTAEAAIYKKSRQALLTKIVEVWAEAKSEDYAKTLMTFVIKVLQCEPNERYEYAYIALQVLKDRVGAAETSRLNEALVMLLTCSELREHSGSSVHNALDTLLRRWSKRLSMDQLSFLLIMDRIVDRPLPRCVVDDLSNQSKVAMSLMNVGQSLIDHLKSFYFDWQWTGFDSKKLLIELTVKSNELREGTQWTSKREEFKNQVATWVSPDRAVDIIIHCKDKYNHALFDIVTPM